MTCGVLLSTFVRGAQTVTVDFQRIVNWLFLVGYGYGLDHGYGWVLDDR